MKLPQVLAGSRRRMFGWLLLNGFAQAALGLAAVVTFDRFIQSKFTSSSHVLVLCGLAAGIYAGRVFQRRHGEMFALDYVNETRMALMEKVLAASDNARQVRLGLVTTRLSSDLLALRTWLSEGVAASIVKGTSLVLLVAGAAVLYWPVALILLCVIIPWAGAVMLLRPSLNRAIGSGRKLRGRLAAVVGDQIMDRLTLAHFGKTTPTLAGLARRSRKLSETIVRRSTISEAMRAMPEWSLPIAAAASLWMVSGGASGATPNAAPLLLLLGMTGNLLTGLSRSTDLHLASRLAMQRLAATFDQPSVERATAAPPPAMRRGAPVEMELALKDATGGESRFHIAAGAVMRLSGGTQAERSAVLAAVARLRDDPMVWASVGEIPSSRYPLRNWRKIVTLASPRLPLIRDTLQKNLAIGAPRGTPGDDVLDIARLLGIVNDPGDLDVIVEPHVLPAATAIAMRLARSLLRNASIILLDESTSAADFPLISAFFTVAQRKRISVVTSGGVMDEFGKPIGQNMEIPHRQPAPPTSGIHPAPAPSREARLHSFH